MKYLTTYTNFLNELIKTDFTNDVLLAKNYSSQNIDGWWYSEKLDGVRAYWDGTRLLSRTGNIFEAPEWFTQDFPKDHLDGELYLGRDRFDEVSGLVRRSNSGDKWKNVKFMVFDSPDEKSPFEKRVSRYTTLCKKSKYLIPVKQAKVLNTDHLYSILSEIESKKGEGVMLRQPGSKYERVRSSILLKVKTFHDMEATVIGYSSGKGKYSGMTGALICELDNGIQFNLSGMTDELRKNPPKIDSRITFKYKEFSKNGKPKMAYFLKMYALT